MCSEVSAEKHVLRVRLYQKQLADKLFVTNKAVRIGRFGVIRITAKLKKKSRQIQDGKSG